MKKIWMRLPVIAIIAVSIFLLSCFEEIDVADDVADNTVVTDQTYQCNTAGRVISEIDINVKGKSLEYENVWPQSILAANDGLYAVLTNDGKIWAWYACFNYIPIDSNGYSNVLYFYLGCKPTMVSGLEDIVSITYCMAVKADGTIYRWRNQDAKIEISKIDGIENAMHIFQIDYTRYLVLLKDRSMVYVENSYIRPIESVCNVEDYINDYVLTTDGCVYELLPSIDELKLIYDPETFGDKARSIGQCEQGTVFQTNEGESYIVQNYTINIESIVAGKVGNSNGSPEYLIGYDGVVLTKSGETVNPEIHNAIYTSKELIITMDGSIYQILSRFYFTDARQARDPMEAGWSQDPQADQVLIKIDPSSLNLQYLVDHNRYKLKGVYTTNENYDDSLESLLMTGQ